LSVLTKVKLFFCQYQYFNCSLTARRFNELPGACPAFKRGVEVPRFLPPDSYRDPVDGCELSCHDETVEMVPSPGKGWEFRVTTK